MRYDKYVFGKLHYKLCITYNDILD